MDILEGRSELKRISRRSLFTLLANQRISNCLIGARACSFSLQHQGIHFCVSELMGKGCQVEGLEQLEQFYREKEKVNFSLPFLQKTETELLLSGKEDVESKVYHTDHLTRSTDFLGKIIERRRKERGDNPKDLFSKATK